MQESSYPAPFASLARRRFLASGVGKTTLIHRICHGADPKNLRWTVGCSIEVKVRLTKRAAVRTALSSAYSAFGRPLQLHLYKNDPTKPFFIEFWDVGGAPRYERSRGVFFKATDGKAPRARAPPGSERGRTHEAYCTHAGVMLVHDLSNTNSFSNLRKWLQAIHDVRRRRHNPHGLRPAVWLIVLQRGQSADEPKRPPTAPVYEPTSPSPRSPDFVRSTPPSTTPTVTPSSSAKSRSAPKEGSITRRLSARAAGMYAARSSAVLCMVHAAYCVAHVACAAAAAMQHQSMRANIAPASCSTRIPLLVVGNKSDLLSSARLDAAGIRNSADLRAFEECAPSLVVGACSAQSLGGD